jgi:hypothetical protein
MRNTIKDRHNQKKTYIRDQAESVGMHAVPGQHRTMRYVSCGKRITEVMAHAHMAAGYRVYMIADICGGGCAMSAPVVASVAPAADASRNHSLAASTHLSQVGYTPEQTISSL